MPRRGDRSLRMTPARIALLGTVPDTDLARRWRCDPSRLMAERHRRGIPPAGPARALTTWAPLEADAQRLWDIYASAAAGPATQLSLVLGWLAAQGWQPDPREIIARVPVPRATAYRHAQAIRELLQTLA